MSGLYEVVVGEWRGWKGGGGARRMCAHVASTEQGWRGDGSAGKKDQRERQQRNEGEESRRWLGKAAEGIELRE